MINGVSPPYNEGASRRAQLSLSGSRRARSVCGEKEPKAVAARVLGVRPEILFSKKLRGFRFSVGIHSPGFFSNAILQFPPLWKGLGSEEEPSNSVG